MRISPCKNTTPKYLVGDVLITPGIERGHETDQIALHPSHPISEQTHMGVADDAIQEVLPTTPTAP